ncbi:O-antigen ligase family protein [Polaribacter sp. IC073]|uniref:O-antigen ligase family protein n=1 Tax=Polaribacter sp. IC073 TaxID=2508540 RepID=UPI0011BFE3E2|nr:O-antigen ligase family protein [Polaribacter sp. IC073]TXD49136.1 O-antigen ligase domain-containing protein [Polaribacter sp. IC073]
MVEKILRNKLLFICIHLVIGYLGTKGFFPSLFGLITIMLPIFIIFQTNNKNEEALLFAAYIVGAEVFIRMTGGFIFYETGKYAVLLFLTMGIVLGKFKQVFSVQYVFYILLLLLGIVFTQVPEGESLRTNITFNLSGPIVLGIAAFYCYQREITLKKLMDMLFFMLLPLFSMIIYLYFRTPDLSEIVFGGEANFVTSGGFGPNQVASAIGLGMFILTVYLLSKQKLSGYLFLDAIFLIYFSYRGLLTFSRGGILTAVVTLLIFLFFYLLHKKIAFTIILRYALVSIAFILSIWLYTLDITGGMLNNRYTGKNAIGVQKDITTGRVDILQIQMENFLENPLGIGVGNGKYERLNQGEGVTGASHNEVGRLLEEHGYIGLLLLIILLVVPLFNFFRGNNYQRAFILSFYAIWFLTINHSAMRIALPGFVYALSLLNITGTNEEEAEDIIDKKSVDDA